MHFKCRVSVGEERSDREPVQCSKHSPLQCSGPDHAVDHSSLLVKRMLHYLQWRAWRVRSVLGIWWAPAPAAFSDMKAAVWQAGAGSPLPSNQSKSMCSVWIKPTCNCQEIIQTARLFQRASTAFKSSAEALEHRHALFRLLSAVIWLIWKPDCNWPEVIRRHLRRLSRSCLRTTVHRMFLGPTDGSSTNCHWRKYFVTKKIILKWHFLSEEHKFEA